MCFTPFYTEGNLILTLARDTVDDDTIFLSIFTNTIGIYKLVQKFETLLCILYTIAVDIVVHYTMDRESD